MISHLGLMITSAAFYHILHFFHISIDIRNVCVFLAPLFSSFTTIVTYHLTKELKVSVCVFRYITYSLHSFGISPAPNRMDVKQNKGEHYFPPWCSIEFYRGLFFLSPSLHL